MRTLRRLEMSPYTTPVVPLGEGSGCRTSALATLQSDRPHRHMFYQPRRFHNLAILQSCRARLALLSVFPFVPIFTCAA